MDYMLCMADLYQHLEDRFVNFDNHKVWVDDINNFNYSNFI